MIRFLLYRGVIKKRFYHTKNCFGHWKKSYISQEAVSEEWLESRNKQSNLWRLITSYHEHGHKLRAVDPLNLHQRIDIPVLSPKYYGLDSSNKTLYNTTGLLFSYPQDKATLSDIIHYLNRMYSQNMTLEVAHINDPLEKEWILNCYEKHSLVDLSREEQLKLSKRLLESQTLDNFLAKKFGTVKRYGAEGAESMMGFFDEVFTSAFEGGISDVVICMPHRGRLNTLTNTLSFSPTHLFHKLKGNSEYADDTPTTGDVASHLTVSTDIQIGSDRTIHVTMVPNPSHLEAVNPVAMGKTRAKLLSRQSGPYTEGQSPKVMCVQVHGDASFAGQGITMECFAISNVPHFEIGGCVHLIVNNYLGFTTPAEYGRSSSYCSDVGKSIGCPILHVNGNFPEDVVRASRIAMEYKLKYEKDIIISLNCYRRWGHNELDDPSMTQPLMYKVIESCTSVPDLYLDKLHTSGVVDDKTLDDDEYNERLNKSFSELDKFVTKETNLRCQWEGLQYASDKITHWDTGLPVDLLKYIGAKSVEVPETLTVHSRLKKSHISERINKIKEDEIDWSTAEAMAVGSLLYQGFNVRLSGQDVGRGTFSHRHMMLVDQDNDEAYIPLNNLIESQKNFLEIANSPLSEEAVLGYEYGYSIESPLNCVIWEAQFGDFFNGAQVIIDTFISSGEDKWLLQSGLVMLLPHGYDGAGPEHSSCRIERFLQMTNSNEDGYDGDNVNMHIVHPTTPSQYFHLLRRQMIRNFRKPLIVQSPKILLRLAAATSSLNDMSPDTKFKPVIEDKVVDPKLVKKIIFCSGKHYYALNSYRTSNNIMDTAIIRQELLCPFPSGEIYAELSKYPNAKEYVWSQEEPANMGPWSFVEPRYRKQLGINLQRASRKPYGPPAVGISKIHQIEVKQLMTDVF